MRILSTTILLGAACTGAIAAQCDPSLSFLAGAPTGISLAENAAVPFDGSHVYFTEVGLHTNPPAPWSSPPFTLNFNIRDEMVASGAANPPDINAHSLGQDWLLVDPTTARIDVPVDRWGVLNFSVTRTTVGAPNSTVHAEAQSPDGPGADLFTYTLPGSTLPSELVDKVTRSHDSREIDVGTGLAQREVDALDQFMSLYTLDPALLTTLPITPMYFFSVSAATVGQVPAFWWNGTPPSAATILMMQFTTPSAGWTPPSVFKTFAEIGLTQADDIDALAIDLANEQIVFSTTNPTLDPILFLDCSTDFAIPEPLKDPIGTPVKTKIGLLEGDDVDAVCGIDPSVRAGSLTNLNAWYYFCGTPTAPVIPAPANPTVQASAFKRQNLGTPQLVTQLVGWPTQTGVGPGIALCTFSPPGMASPLLTLGSSFRNVTPVFCGDPKRVVINVPLGLILTNFDFDLRWWVADLALTEIHDVHPLRIRL